MGGGGGKIEKETKAVHTYKKKDLEFFALEGGNGRERVGNWMGTGGK